MEENTLPYRAVDVRLAEKTYDVLLGEQLVIPFAVANQSGNEDYFDVAVQGIPTAWLVLDMPVVRLASGEQREVGLTIQAPANSPLSVGQYPVTIQVSGQRLPALRGEAQFTLRINTYEDTIAYLPEATTQAVPAPDVTIPGGFGSVETGGRIGLLLDSVQFSAAPGDTLAIPVVVANRGMREDAFYLSVEGLPPGWVSLSVPAVSLLPGEHGEVVVYLQPPQGHATRAGRHPFAFRAVSQSDPENAAVVEAVLTLAAVSQFMADLTPRRIEGGQKARLRIHNLGNFQDTFHVQMQSTEGQLSFTPAAAGPLQLMPGETITLDFAVAPRTPTLFGSPTRYAYNAVVQASGGDAQTHSGELISRAVVPIWVIPAVLVFCLTALCGVGYLWNFNRTGTVWATRTAAAQLGFFDSQTATAAVLVEQAGAATAAAMETQFAMETRIAIEGETAAGTATAEAAFQLETAMAQATLAADALATEVAGFLQATEMAATATAVQFFAEAQAQTATAAALAIPTDTPVPTLAPPTPTIAPTQTPVPLPVAGEQYLVFSSNREGLQRLYLFHSASAALRPLTDGAGADAQPAWSPDGTRLLFTSNREGNNEVYLLTLADGSIVNMSQNASDDRFPAWSPDGTRIAFTTNRDGNNEIYVMNLDRSGVANLTASPANDYKPAWYSERTLLGTTSRILFATDRDGNHEIYSMNPDGSDPVNLTNHPTNDAFPAVPFNGGIAAFVSDRDGNADIFTIALNGEGAANVTNSPANDVWPTWSEDGEWIAFASNREGRYEIYIVRRDGSGLTNITNSASDELDPAWR